MKLRAIGATVAILGLGAHAEETSLPLINDPEVIAAMITVWKQSASGSKRVEATFRLDGNPSGYTVVIEPFTNQFMRQRASVVPGITFAVFHVHPKTADPAPSQQDRDLANKYGFRILTLHSYGLYEYNPATKKTTKLRDRMTWIKPAPNSDSSTSSSYAGLKDH